MKTENSKEYEAARLTANAATREFMKAQAAYRSLQIGDAEFLAAKAIHDKAQGVFDDALLAELNYTATI